MVIGDGKGNLEEGREMKRKWYREMASRVDAYHTCVKTGNTLWEEKHEARIVELLDMLPHGSGIDGTTDIALDKSSGEKLIILSSYHHMNDGGYYDGWTEFKVIVTPSLQFGARVKVTGSFPRRYADTRDYLHEVFDSAINEEVE